MDRTQDIMKTYFIACNPALLVFWVSMAICALVVLLALFKQGVTNALVYYILVNLITIFLYSFMVTTFCKAWGDIGGWLYVLVPIFLAVLLAVSGGVANDKLTA